MIRLSESATTRLSRKDAFRHIGDFGNIDQWDPGVISSSKSTPGPVGPGTVYDLVLTYRGRRLEMQYEVIDHVPGSRIVLEGTGSVVKAIDVIEFSDFDDGTRIEYTADLSLTGLARLFEPLLKDRLTKIGTDAVAGMRRWLSELEAKADVEG